MAAYTGSRLIASLSASSSQVWGGRWWWQWGDDDFVDGFNDNPKPARKLQNYNVNHPIRLLSTINQSICLEICQMTKNTARWWHWPKYWWRLWPKKRFVAKKKQAFQIWCAVVPCGWLGVESHVEGAPLPFTNDIAQDITNTALSD